jgi:hypothetical protein
MEPAPFFRPFQLVALGLALAAANAIVAAPAWSEAEAIAFTDRHCSSCHNDVDREGGLDLTSLTLNPQDPANFLTWVKVHDRVSSGEMPPKEKRAPAANDRAAFLGGLSKTLVSVDQAAIARDGRATRRRMNRAEYENSLRDLLSAPLLRVQGQLPEDGEAFRFNKVSSALDVSYVHMARYMSAADFAMRQAMSIAWSRPAPVTKRYYAREVFTGGAGGMADSFRTGSPDRLKFPALGTQPQPDVRALKAPITVGESNPEIREQEAVGWVHSQYAPTGISFVWGDFAAPATGRYRARFSGYTLWVGPYGFRRHEEGTGDQKRKFDGPREWQQPNYNDVQPGRRDEPVIIYSRSPTTIRRLGAFDLTPEVAVNELEVDLQANDSLVTDAARFYRSRPTGYQGGFTNPLAQPDGAPAVAFRWMEVEGPLDDAATTAGYRLLFGDLPMQRVEAGQPGVAIEAAGPPGRGGRGGRAGPGSREVKVEVVSRDVAADSERLLRAFVQRAYRRPVEEADVRLFLGLIKQRREAGLGFAGSMLAGYTAVLASPAYVYVDEQPGRLDDYALATRLALFLWNTPPDAELRSLAARGELHRPEVLRKQAERLLADAKSERFISAFLDYWLELRKMEDTSPSTTLYNDYYLDDSLTEAAVDETHLFFGELIRRDLPARNVVDSDFTFLNERLARHYGVAGVEGVALRPVALPPGSPRGGLMTQASVLKVTANGTTTSPVLRGKWIMERIVGYDMPLPPAAVPAVEPDIRGAVTIRQQLDKHRADESCAACHRKIDPPGFALENFDVLGGWRERYRATALDAAPAVGFGKNGWPFAFYFAQPVDPSGSFNGRAFADVKDFKRLLLEDETQLARNVVRQLSIFATGAPIRFADGEKIERILQETKSGGYGVRSLIHGLVQSELFLNK